MIEWFLYGSIFNFVYYLMKWDHFMMKVTLMNLEQAEKNLGSFISSETKEKINEYKDICINYENKVSHNLFTIAVDLILFPLYFLGLLFACVDYFLIKRGSN